eukprot:TRINITY_DN1651_c0_g1_i4.p1 TRINITY_DN1651_c0_g1~~TRINITY_DN1651_c0_g1_i4.p1  ORF type:complete len:230 (+),score=47.62 TRINITY_DN1651_c0_g1_i4:149-838(+)
MSTEVPLEYLMGRLEEENILLTPEWWYSSSDIQCLSLLNRKGDAPNTHVGFSQLADNHIPVLYNSEVCKSITEATNEEFGRLVMEQQLANAQNPTGETILMKMVRHAFSSMDRRTGPSHGFVQTMLNAGANPMVCCSSGKNVLHDLVWAAMPCAEEQNPSKCLELMEFIARSLLSATGKMGMLKLMLSKDKNGDTPVEYINPVVQVRGGGGGEGEDFCAFPPSGIGSIF